MANSETFGWDWSKFQGSEAGLRWNRRDLPNLEEVIGLTPEHTAVVQAGGNLGIWPKRLSRAFETVYTFEPDPQIFAMLCFNAPEENIVKIQAALGFERGLVGMCKVRRDDKPTNHEGITHVAGPGVLPVLRVDDLELPVCDLLYLDIEGSEFDALRGAAETIKRCRPIVSVEINKNAGFVGIAKEAIAEQVLKHGYEQILTLSKDHIFAPKESR